MESVIFDTDAIDTMKQALHKNDDESHRKINDNEKKIIFWHHLNGARWSENPNTNVRYVEATDRSAPHMKIKNSFCSWAASVGFLLLFLVSLSLIANILKYTR